MAGHTNNLTNHSKVNRLQKELPAGLLAPASWLNEHGYYRQLLNHYVASGWLESPARGVYRRPGTSLKWQHVVASLQKFCGGSLHVGGSTALVHRGFGHYVQMKGPEKILLFGPDSLPAWVHKLKVQALFKARNDAMFATLRVGYGDHGMLHSQGKPVQQDDLGNFGLMQFSWGEGDWPLLCSSEERAILEVLQDVPGQESVYEAHVLMQGLVGLRPGRLMKLLKACASIKVKRLFFALAERHNHAWFKHLDPDAIEFGSGKRMLRPGGTMDSKYRITLPADLDDYTR